MKDKIFKIFSSNIKIKVSGKNINIFIKRLIKNRINIIRVIPISYREAYLIIDYNDLESISKMKTVYDIEITKYYGKLKILKLFKMNIYVISFLIIGIILIYILSNIIFNVEIIHSNSNIIKILEEELYNHGIKKYSFVKSYSEIENIEKDILKNNKENLDWLEIIRNGTSYIVRVEERIIQNNIHDDKNYDVVASKNAVIKSIIAESGEKIRSINTYVKKGEVVISSQITKPNNEIIIGSAKGKVVGEVWYSIDVEFPYNYNEIIYTGNKKKVFVFNFLNKRIALFDFNEYKSFNKDTKYIFNDNFIPFSLTYEYQYETNIIDEIYTYDEAKNKAIDLAKEKLLSKYDSIININNVTVVSEEDLTSKISLSLFVSCDEDITEYREIIYDIEDETIQ